MEFIREIHGHFPSLKAWSKTIPENLLCFEIKHFMKTDIYSSDYEVSRKFREHINTVIPDSNSDLHSNSVFPECFHNMS